MSTYAPEQLDQIASYTTSHPKMSTASQQPLQQQQQQQQYGQQYGNNNNDYYDGYDHDDMGFAAHPTSRWHPRNLGSGSGSSSQMTQSRVDPRQYETHQLTSTQQSHLPTNTTSGGAGNVANVTPGSLLQQSNQQQSSSNQLMQGGMFAPTIDPSRMIMVDVIETPRSYLLHADLPGYRKQDINISIHNGMLTISANRANQNQFEQTGQQGEYVYRRVERSQGQISRTMRVPQNADVSQLQTAKFEDGMLKLEIPKVSNTKALPKPTNIPVH